MCHSLEMPNFLRSGFVHFIQIDGESLSFNSVNLTNWFFSWHLNICCAKIFLDVTIMIIHGILNPNLIEKKNYRCLTTLFFAIAC